MLAIYEFIETAAWRVTVFETLFVRNFFTCYKQANKVLL